MATCTDCTSRHCPHLTPQTYLSKGVRGDSSGHTFSRAPTFEPDEARARDLGADLSHMRYEEAAGKRQGMTRETAEALGAHLPEQVGVVWGCWGHGGWWAPGL